MEGIEKNEKAPYSQAYNVFSLNSIAVEIQNQSTNNIRQTPDAQNQMAIYRRVMFSMS